MTDTLQSKELRAMHEVLAKHFELLEKIVEAEDIEEVEDVLSELKQDNYEDIDANYLEAHLNKGEHMEAVKALIDDIHQTDNQDSDEPVTNFFNKKENPYV